MKNTLVKTISGLPWGRVGAGTCCLAALVLAGASPRSVQGADNTADDNLPPVRFAFSSRMFTDVNENDAKASVKAWALALARERHVPMSTEPIILSGDAALKQALQEASIDGAAVTTEEYLNLEPRLQGTNLFMSSIGGRFTEEYLLLVRGDSGLADLRGLRGRKILMFDNPRASLAPLWLDLILSEQGLGAAEGHFGQILKAPKLAKVVLPVFFRQGDACVVTRRGFDTMCELNPQVRAQLRVLATSPELVPAVGFIRAGYDSTLRDAMLAALRHLEQSAAGTQVLTLFQSDQLQEAPESLLNSARELLEAHRHLKPAAAGEPGQSRPPPQIADGGQDP
jgi:phosphonate transport system substrate-binding protein